MLLLVMTLFALSKFDFILALKIKIIELDFVHSSGLCKRTQIGLIDSGISITWI